MYGPSSRVFDWRFRGDPILEYLRRCRIALTAPSILVIMHLIKSNECYQGFLGISLSIRFWMQIQIGWRGE